MSQQPDLFEKKRKISFTVIGTPQPQGSSRAFIPKGWTRAVITSSNAKLKPWRQEMAGTALATRERLGVPLIEKEPVIVAAIFYFDKPKSAKKSLRDKVTKPDCDKLLRALFDALTGTIFKDDSQVVSCHVRKEFGSPNRVEVSVAIRERVSAQAELIG
jgi:crossover junction endodeoxyribonuclease RusA